MEWPSLPKDQFIKIHSVNTRYWVVGNGHPPIVMVHGLGGYAENWMYNVSDLSKHFKVYVIDLAGFGKSDKPEAPYTYNYFAGFLHDFMVKMGIEKAHLIGHSMGGGIILQFALKHPNRVKKLILVASSGLGKKITPMFKLTSLPLLGRWLTKPSRKGISRLYKSMVYDKQTITEAMVELGYQMNSLPGAQQAFLSANQAIVHFFGQKQQAMDPIRNNLQLIEAHVMVIWGQQDKILPPSHARVAKSLIANVITHIFDRCGHLPMLEYPKKFNAAVNQFLIDGTDLS